MLKEFFKKLNITLWNTILTVAFFTGLLLVNFEINIYRLTFIPWIIPTCIWLITGLLITPFTTKLLAAEIRAYSLFWQAFFNIAAWGGIVVYIFMASNFCFTRHDAYQTLTPVLSAGNLAKGRYGCGEPYVDINYAGQQKELIFPCGALVTDYKFTNLTLETGFWGYEVIKNQTLTNPAISN